MNLYPFILIRISFFSVLLLGALVAIGIADGLQIKPSGRKEESYPYSLDKCCNFAFRLYKVSGETLYTVRNFYRNFPKLVTEILTSYNFIK